MSRSAANIDIHLLQRHCTQWTASLCLSPSLSRTGNGFGGGGGGEQCVRECAPLWLNREVCEHFKKLYTTGRRQRTGSASAGVGAGAHHLLLLRNCLPNQTVFFSGTHKVEASVRKKRELPLGVAPHNGWSCHRCRSHTKNKCPHFGLWSTESMQSIGVFTRKTGISFELGIIFSSLILVIHWHLFCSLLFRAIWCANSPFIILTLGSYYWLRWPSSLKNLVC